MTSSYSHVTLQINTNSFSRRVMTLKNDSGVIPFPPAAGFQRKLRRSGALIECKCVRCGFRFIGSVSHKLATVETIHVDQCSSKKPASLREQHSRKARKAHA